MARPEIASRVFLALGLGDLDQVGVGQPRRLREDRARDLDLVVLREPAHHLDRGVVDRRKVPAQLGERADLHALDQVHQNIVEDLDLLLVEPVAVVQEQIRHPPQRFDALFRGAALQRILEIGNRRDIGGLLHAPTI